MSDKVIAYSSHLATGIAVHGDPRGAGDIASVEAAVSAYRLIETAKVNGGDAQARLVNSLLLLPKKLDQVRAILGVFDAEEWHAIVSYELLGPGEK